MVWPMVPGPRMNRRAARVQAAGRSPMRCSLLDAAGREVVLDPAGVAGQPVSRGRLTVPW
jgi:hypothetical protein